MTKWICLTPGTAGALAREVTMARWNECGQELLIALGAEYDGELHPDRRVRITLTRDELANMPQPPLEVPA